jgi:hypothetical protein
MQPIYCFLMLPLRKVGEHLLFIAKKLAIKGNLRSQVSTLSHLNRICKCNFNRQAYFVVYHPNNRPGNVGFHWPTRLDTSGLRLQRLGYRCERSRQRH